MDEDNPSNSAGSANRPVIEVTLSTRVSDALMMLEQAGLTAVTVTDHGRPVGVVTALGLRNSATRSPAPDTEVGEVMDLEVVHIKPSSGVEDTLRTFRDAAWHSVRRRRPFAQAAE